MIDKQGAGRIPWELEVFSDEVGIVAERSPIGANPDCSVSIHGQGANLLVIDFMAGKWVDDLFFPPKKAAMSGANPDTALGILQKSGDVVAFEILKETILREAGCLEVRPQPHGVIGGFQDRVNIKLHASPSFTAFKGNVLPVAVGKSAVLHSDPQPALA